MVLPVIASSSTPEVRVFPSAAALTEAVAAALVKLIESKTSAGERFSIALSGGNTPRALYERLAQDYRENDIWPNVDFFWGDERYVPSDDPRSNYRTAEESLLKPLGIRASQIHPMPTSFDLPDEAAYECAKMLQSYFSSQWPRFDLVLLGMGAEGHTASLFPESPALNAESRWVVATRVPADPPNRLTLTPHAFTEAGNIWFLVTGKEKAPAVRDALASSAQLNPAGMIRPANGALVWWLDDAAASLLPKFNN